MTGTPIKTPQVVVACAWYNRADYIRDTVDSLLAQDFDDFEIVIVNDGSPEPRVREILDSYDDPRLRVIHQENTGFVGAITRAIAASDAPFIAIQGSADISYPDRLRKQAAVLEARPEVTVVGSRVDNILDIETGRKQVYGTPADGDLRQEALTRILMMHGEVAFRRSSYLAVGGYRPFFRFSQDRDLWCRLSRLGSIVVLEDVLCRRFANMGGVSGDSEKQIVQRFLGHFAVYCHAEVMAGRIDPLERFGPQAGLMYQGTYALQKDMLRLAIRYFLANNPEGAEAILKVAQRLKGGPVAWLLGKLLKILPKPVHVILTSFRNLTTAVQR